MLERRYLNGAKSGKNCLVSIFHVHADWTYLINGVLDQPRSQFLQMGFHFASLFIHYQSLKPPESLIDTKTLLEMIEHAKSIIFLAINTSDERTRHLTDHIYHLVTFSALILCRLRHIYEKDLTPVYCDIDALDTLVWRLINWFRSIGLKCHIAHTLADVLAAQFHKVPPTWLSESFLTSGASLGPENDFLLSGPSLTSSSIVSFTGFTGSESYTEIDDGNERPPWA